MTWNQRPWLSGVSRTAETSVPTRTPYPWASGIRPLSSQARALDQGRVDRGRLPAARRPEVVGDLLRLGDHHASVVVIQAGDAVVVRYRRVLGLDPQALGGTDVG